MLCDGGIPNWIIVKCVVSGTDQMWSVPCPGVILIQR
jgi:hypothetical protein